MTALLVSDLTDTTLAGSGIFDILMRANSVHLDTEFKHNRIKGVEYAGVYQAAMQSAWQVSMDFVMQSRKNDIEVQILAQQLILSEAAVTKSNIEEDMLAMQLLIATQQRDTAALQALNIPKEGLLLDRKICESKAQYDLLLVQKTKSLAENELLVLKSATEKAQTLSLGVDADSVLGKQKALYQAQTDGFKRDAEQKAAKLMADVWSVRRSTDTDNTAADDKNMLYDTSVGRAVTKMLAGVGA